MNNPNPQSSDSGQRQKNSNENRNAVPPISREQAAALRKLIDSTDPGIVRSGNNYINIETKHTNPHLASTIRELGTELARRLDDLQHNGHLDSHAAISLGGILEWLKSFEDALRQCNDKPSPRR